MGTVSLSEIPSILRKAALDGLPHLKIAILRNVMLEPIEPYLRYFAYTSGINAQVHFGQFDNIFQEATDPASRLWSEQADIVLVFSKLESLSSRLASSFPGLRPDEIKDECEHVQAFVTGTLDGLRRHCSAAILWHGFEMPAYPALGIHDSQIDDGQTGVIRGLNSFLRNSLRKTANANFVDLDVCLARLGIEAFYDLRLWQISRAPYSRKALELIAAEDMKFIRALHGKFKKCLVLDCDNVLWGGSIGEEGLQGITLAQDYPGSTYYQFQHEVLSLYNRGVILALCSKNNAADVWEVFHKHPNMIIKEEHIAAAQINWNDKASNLRRIAEDLNIGLDSMVFVDDSDFEVQLVRELVPEIEVIHLPNQEAVRFRQILASPGWFDSVVLSEEDQRRGSMYKAEAERKRYRTQVSDVTEYLRSLQMQVDIQPVSDVSLPRVAQLTQRTNQFNLTTRRYTEEELWCLAGSDDHDVLCLKLDDGFGSYGIVGATIVRHGNGISEIVALLLSCRVIGRGVEDTLLGACIEVANLRGSSMARGRYIKTAKNELVAGFYLKHGFSTEYQDGNEATYVSDLNSTSPKTPSHFKSVRITLQEATE